MCRWRGPKRYRWRPRASEAILNWCSRAVIERIRADPLAGTLRSASRKSLPLRAVSAPPLAAAYDQAIVTLAPLDGRGFILGPD
jgi:hypothetical protein